MAAGVMFTPGEVGSPLRTKWADAVARCVEHHLKRFGEMPKVVFLPAVQYRRWRKEFGPLMSVWVLKDELPSFEESLVQDEGREALVCTMKVLKAEAGEVEPSVR